MIQLKILQNLNPFPLAKTPYLPYPIRASPYPNPMYSTTFVKWLTLLTVLDPPKHSNADFKIANDNFVLILSYFSSPFSDIFSDANCLWYIENSTPIPPFMVKTSGVKFHVQCSWFADLTSFLFFFVLFKIARSLLNWRWIWIRYSIEIALFSLLQKPLALISVQYTITNSKTWNPVIIPCRNFNNFMLTMQPYATTNHEINSKH